MILYLTGFIHYIWDEVFFTFKVSRVSIIVRLWDKWRLHLKEVVPVYAGKEAQLPHICNRRSGQKDGENKLDTVLSYFKRCTGGENKKLMFSFSGLKYKDINNAFVTLLQDLKRAINQFDIFYFILKIGVRPLFIIAAKLTNSAVIDKMQQGLRNW